MKNDSILTDHLRILPPQQKALKKIDILTVEDILHYFPSRYGDTSEIKSIESLARGEAAVIFGKISGLKMKKAWKKKIPMAEGMLEDETGSIKVVWFNQPYLAKMLQDGSFVRAEGKVSERKGELYLSNPKIENIAKLPLHTGATSLFGEGNEDHYLYPVYPETRGVTSNWIFHAIQKVFKSGLLDELVDPIPESILKKYNLPTLKTALIWIHTPKNKDDALSARKRFAFEEVFFIQLEKHKSRKLWQQHDSFEISKKFSELTDFISRFPFPLTEAQKKSVNHILDDFKKGVPMARLLEGDVGSGKTAVAATASFAVISTKPKNQDFGNLQVAYMVPTEILAEQHFESFVKYFAYTGVQVGLITGSGARKFPSKINPLGATNISRSQLLKWVASGEIPILIGTHTLIQKSVKFKHLAFSIIDEQHKFGTTQRQKFRERGGVIPHLLSMTATPIPRTLALTVYGDLDLSLLDELPPGRKWPITEIVLPNTRGQVYEKIRKELRSGRQAYVICPRIDEPDPTREMALIAKSVTEEAKRLKKDVFTEFQVGVMHGKMKPGEKDEVMNDFKDGKINILVSTSVVEVGVNVPNATIIIIEGAERFGLAQLHQLRGRVMRSSHQPYCYIFSETKSGKSMDRLKALRTAKSGFELAEFDLVQRGAGELYGRKQWGLSDIGMEAIKNLKMVEAARLEAGKLIEEDPELKKYPILKNQIDEKRKQFHFE
jgi:ATP-dependent DNA helicase RecG